MLQKVYIIFILSEYIQSYIHKHTCICGLCDYNFYNKYRAYLFELFKESEMTNLTISKAHLKLSTFTIFIT